VGTLELAERVTEPVGRVRMRPSQFQESDAPVGIHAGTGPSGAPYLGFERYRARLHSALVLEDVLIRHPELRVFIGHAGWPMLDDLLAVLWTHPQVHVKCRGDQPRVAAVRRSTPTCGESLRLASESACSSAQIRWCGRRR
jgi:hypothetical protein